MIKGAKKYLVPVNGRKVRDYFLQKGLYLKDFAQKCGYSSGGFSQAIRNNLIDEGALYILTEELGVPNDFFDGSLAPDTTTVVEIKDNRKANDEWKLNLTDEMKEMVTQYISVYPQSLTALFQTMFEEIWRKDEALQAELRKQELRKKYQAMDVEALVNALVERDMQQEQGQSLCP